MKRFWAFGLIMVLLCLPVTPSLANEQKTPPTITSISTLKYSAWMSEPPDQLTCDRVTLYADGTLTVQELQLYDKEGTAYTADAMPVIRDSTAAVETAEFDKLVSTLRETKLEECPEYLETGVCDGWFAWITLTYENGESYTTGGVVADSEGPEVFVDAWNAIKNIVKSANLS